jgi:N-acetylglucosaminyl-diphospho-decaprenol L-rhamnosyltransferase
VTVDPQPLNSLAFGIVTHYSSSDLRVTLPTTVQIAKALNAEVLVYDNASNDDSVAIARSVPNVDVTEGKRNRGYAHAVNQLALKTGTRDLLLLNPDVRVNSTAPIVELAEQLKDRRVGVVAPRLLNPDGSTQTSVRRFPTFLGHLGRSTTFERIPSIRRRAEAYAEAYVQLPTAAGPQVVDWAIGAALLIRNSAYRRVGGLDERFFLYLEDADFCLRLAAVGYSTLYVPSATFVHTHHRASDVAQGSWLRSSPRRHHIRSTIKFFAKHRSLAPRPG